MAPNNELSNDSPTPAIAAARAERRTIVQQIRHDRYQRNQPSTPSAPRPLQESHNDSLVLNLDPTRFRRRNRSDPEQGTADQEQEQGAVEQEQGHNMDDLGNRGRSTGGPSRGHIGGASRDRDRDRNRSRSSMALDSSIFHQTLKEAITVGTPKPRTEVPELPVDPAIVDFSEYLVLLSGTASQGHTEEELIAANPGDLTTMIANNRQLWFDVLSLIPTFIKEHLDRRNRDLRKYKDENQRLRNERNALRSAGPSNNGKQAIDAPLMREYEEYKEQAEATIIARNNELQDVYTEVWSKDDKIKTQDAELDQFDQELSAMTAERDQAKSNLEREQHAASQSQTQQPRNIFERPIFTRPGAPAGNHAPQHQRAATPLRQQTPANTITSSSSSATKLDPRFPNPEVFAGDKATYRIWRSKMQAKLRASYGVGIPDLEADTTAILDFVHSRTEGQAWQIIDNHTSDLARTPWTSLTELWDELDRNYMAKDEEAKAEMAFMLNRQAEGESYQKWMITLRDLAARSGKILKAQDVWMKLNTIYQRKAIPYRFATNFTELDDFCVNEEEAHEAMKALRPVVPKTAAADGAGRGRGRGRGDAGGTNNTGAGRGGRSDIVRYLPLKFKGLPKSTDPVEGERIRKNNLCFSCRQTGHGAGSPQCPFNMDKGRFAFADVPREMSKADGDALINGRGRQAHLAIQQFDDANELPEPEQLQLHAPGQQGNGSLRQ
jgi:hypothetical protein